MQTVSSVAKFQLLLHWKWTKWKGLNSTIINTAACSKVTTSFYEGQSIQSYCSSLRIKQCYWWTNMGLAQRSAAARGQGAPQLLQLQQTWMLINDILTPTKFQHPMLLNGTYSTYLLYNCIWQSTNFSSLNIRNYKVLFCLTHHLLFLYAWGLTISLIKL